MVVKYFSLVRDNLVKRIKKEGKDPIYRVLDNDEYWSFLMRTATEQLNDVAIADDNEMEEELAHAYEMLRTMAEFNGLDMSDVIEKSESKRKEEGSYQEKIYLDKVIEPDKELQSDDELFLSFDQVMALMYEANNVKKNYKGFNEEIISSFETYVLERAKEIQSTSPQFIKYFLRNRAKYKVTRRTLSYLSQLTGVNIYNQQEIMMYRDKVREETNKFLRDNYGFTLFKKN